MRWSRMKQTSEDNNTKKKIKTQLRAAGEELTQFLMLVLTPESVDQSHVATRLAENPTAFYSMLFTVFNICLLKTKETKLHCTMFVASRSFISVYYCNFYEPADHGPTRAKSTPKPRAESFSCISICSK